MNPAPLAIRLDQPCQVPWDEMEGDARVRFCTQCKLHVHNLSAMTEAEAAAFLAMRDRRVCVSYQRREDGTATFSDTVGNNHGGRGRSLPVLPYAPRPSGRRRWLVPTAVAGALASAGAVAALQPNAVPRIAGGGTAAVACGGISAPPLVQFDPRSITTSGACTTAVPQTRKLYLQYDPLGTALQDARPGGADVIDVRHRVYPPGGTANAYGQAYVLGAAAADPAAPPDVRAVVWLVRTRTPRQRPVGEIDPSTGLRHVATLERYEVFVECDDASLADAARDALVAADCARVAAEAQVKTK